VSAWQAVLLVVVLETACGLGALALLGVTRSRRELRRRAGLAPLTGIAWTGVAAATLATAGARLGLAGLVALTVATCVAGALRVRAGRAAADAPGGAPASLPERLLAAAFLGAIAVLTFFALAAFHDKPLAEYDGWAIWGTKAKAIAVLGSADTAVFTGSAYERLHLDYPLLVPGLHALPLQALDDYWSGTIILNCLALGAAGLLALWGIYRDRVRPALVLGFLAAIVAMPAFLTQLGTGYADVPVALLVAAGVAAAARWLADGDRGWLALATLFLAASTLTKNEGLLFAACAYVALLLVARGRRKEAAVSAVVAALTYAPWQLYTAVHGLERGDFDLSSSFDVPWVVDRLDRAPVAGRELLEQAVEPRQFGLVLGLGVAAWLLALAVGDRRLGAFAACFALVSAGGLTWIYVLTPFELGFYLSTNSDRVVVAPIVALGALAPLLVEESARSLAARDDAETSATPGSLVSR
jgi:hypothetical protein